MIPAAPLLSLALTLTITLPDTLPVAGLTICTTGGAVSREPDEVGPGEVPVKDVPFATLTEMVVEALEFPAASKA